MLKVMLKVMLNLCCFYVDDILKDNKGKLVMTRSQLYEQLRPRSKMQNAQNYFLYSPETSNHPYPNEKSSSRKDRKKTAARPLNIITETPPNDLTSKQ